MVRGARRERARLIAGVRQVQNYAAPIADFLMNGWRLIRISEGAYIGSGAHLAAIYARLCQRILRRAIKDARRHARREMRRAAREGTRHSPEKLPRSRGESTPRNTGRLSCDPRRDPAS